MGLHVGCLYHHSRMAQYKVGDHVQWTRAVSQPRFKNAKGLVTAVLDNDTQVDDLTLYDVQFEFGLFTLYGTQLDPVPIRTNPTN